MQGKGGMVAVVGREGQGRRGARATTWSFMCARFGLRDFGDWVDIGGS